MNGENVFIMSVTSLKAGRTPDLTQLTVLTLTISG